MFIVGHHDRSTSIIQKNLISSLKRTQESTERLSSGKRVNKSSDDPGNTGTISKLNAKIGSISEALKNASSAK
ncbi:MAG: hypothetical protein CMN44_00970, partial [SAR116 cluster bacterium]